MSSQAPLQSGAGMGKGKGKGVAPPAPPTGEAAVKAKAEVEEKRRAHQLAERLEAEDAIRAAKELEAKKKNLENRLPTLSSHNLHNVDWDSMLAMVHLVGGKGGGGGVEVVELRDGSAVCIRTAQSIVTEMVADGLATALDIRVARMRLVRSDSAESHAISHMRKRYRPDWSKDVEKHLKKMEYSHSPEEIECVRARFRKLPSLAVVEFVAGISLDKAGDALSLSSDLTFVDIGRLCALDILINNMDRLPLPCWDNNGNLTNAILTADGTLVGIDQQVNPIHSDGLQLYLHKVRCLTAQLMEPGAVASASVAMASTSVTMRIRKALKEHCGVEVSVSSMDAVIRGLCSGLRDVAMCWRSGALAVALGLAQDAASEAAYTAAQLGLTFCASEVAARDAAFVLQVAEEIASIPNIGPVAAGVPIAASSSPFVFAKG